MDSKQNHRRKITQAIVFPIVIMLLVGPVIVYVLTFGTELSDSHSRWAEMGSAMSGIYTPILSLLALLVLVNQVSLQHQINEHQYDQSYLQEVRSDIQFYLVQLDQALSEQHSTGVTVRSYLNSLFAHKDLISLQSEELLRLARQFDQAHPRVCAIWFAVYPMYAGLQAVNRFPYEHNFTAALQKTISMISFETCAALDNFHWCLTEGRMSFKYQFSPDVMHKPA